RQLVNDTNRSGWQHAVRVVLKGYAPPTWTAPAGESDESRASRNAVLEGLGLYGADPDVIAGAREITNKFLSDPMSVDQTDARSALSIAANFGDAALFDRLTSLYDAATIPGLKEAYLFALTEFRDPALVGRAIDFAFSGKVRSQDMPGFIASLMFNPFARTQTWTAVKNHWADLQRDVTTAMGAFTRPLGQF